MHLIFRIVITTLLVFLAAPLVSAQVPVLGTLYIHSEFNYSYISSEILNPGEGPVILCQYTLDDGVTWRTGSIETNYGISYCKASGSNIETVNPNLISMKAVNSVDQTGSSIPPAVFSNFSLELPTFIIDPSYLDRTTNVRYVPSNVTIRAQINNAYSGIKSCVFKNNDVPLRDVIVTKLESSNYACTNPWQLPGGTQLNILLLEAMDNINYQLDSEPMSVVLDIIPPISTISSVALNGSVISINASALDEMSGIKKVALWYRLQGVSDWRQIAEQSASVQSGFIGPRDWQTTFSLDKNTIGGNGAFEFFVVASDVVGNSEQPKYIAEKGLTITNTPPAPSITDSPMPTVTGLVEELPVSVTQEMPVTTPTKMAEEKQEFLADWIDYKVDEDLSFYLDSSSDNVVFDDTGAKGFKFYGKAPAGVEVRISIFSDRYDLTTTADENGDWEVAMDQSLSGGDHTAYLYYLNSEQDYYRLEKEMVLNVDLNNRMIFSDLSILPQSGAEESTKGIISLLLMIFGVVMIVIAIAGLNYRRMFHTNEIIEVLPRQKNEDTSQIVVVGQPGQFV